MSIRDFHAQLVSGNNKNNLFSALSKISRIADTSSLFSDEPAADWPYWGESSNPPSLVSSAA
jgi:hypothetical protein